MSYLRINGFFFPLCAAEDSRKQAVGLGAHCLSSAVVRGVGAPPGRVAQPRLFATIEGTPKGWRTGVAVFLVTLFLAMQEKVTSCRSATGTNPAPYADNPSSFVTKLASSGGSGALMCIASPVSGCVKAMLCAWRNMRFRPCFINSRLRAKSPYLSSPAIGKPR